MQLAFQAMHRKGFRGVPPGLVWELGGGVVTVASCGPWEQAAGAGGLVQLGGRLGPEAAGLGAQGGEEGF